MEFKSKGDKELLSIITEQSMNNTGAVRTLVEVICRSGLISIDDFNKLVKEETRTVKKEMENRVKNAEK